LQQRWRGLSVTTQVGTGDPHSVFIPTEPLSSTGGDDLGL